MFDAWCERCAARVLLTTRRVRRVEHLDGGGIDVHFTCWCGTDGTWQTGRDRVLEASVPTMAADCA